MIGFNKPYFTGKETEYIKQAVAHEKISGDGTFTARCHEFFVKKYGFRKVLLTTSCTDALEMAAILADIKPGDEVIAPSFTFVSTVNAFVLRGAKIVFVDSSREHPGMDVQLIEQSITPRTRAIVVVHYAGVACDMDVVTALAEKYKLVVVEDAAHSIDSRYKGIPLGSIGHFGTFSFHETKNIISGEGGMLAINDERFFKRAEIIREKGTNRSAFFRGEVDKYTWVDIGSSFLPSEIISAFLFAQLENLDRIQKRRIEIWNLYDSGLKPLRKLEGLILPHLPAFATNNAHIYYLVCHDLDERSRLIEHLRKSDIQVISHYTPLHLSPYYRGNKSGIHLTNAEHYASALVRLPLYYELRDEQVAMIVRGVRSFFGI